METMRFYDRGEAEAFVERLGSAATVRLGDDDIDLTQSEALDYMSRARNRDLQSSEPADPYLVRYETADLAAEAAALEAAGEDHDAEVVRSKMKKAADFDARDEDGYTPLHRAVMYCQTDHVRALLDAGASVHAVTEERGETALHVAATHGHVEAAVALLAAGARVSAVDLEGYTPLHLACGSVCPSALAAILLDAGADPDAESKSGCTPWDMAHACQNEAALEVLAAHERRGLEESTI